MSTTTLLFTYYHTTYIIYLSQSSNDFVLILWNRFIGRLKPPHAETNNFWNHYFFSFYLGNFILRWCMHEAQLFKCFFPPTNICIHLLWLIFLLTYFLLQKKSKCGPSVLVIVVNTMLEKDISWIKKWNSTNRQWRRER